MTAPVNVPLLHPKFLGPSRFRVLQPSSMPLAPANAGFCWQTMQAG